MAKFINSEKSTFLKFNFNDDIFQLNYEEQLNPTTLVLLESGAMVNDSRIANLISNGGNYYSVPFYKDLDDNDEEGNYDGMTDIPKTGNESGIYHGVVWGRTKGWAAKDFVSDFSTADPMAFILRRVKEWESRKLQKRFIGILEALFKVKGTGEFTDWESHKINIASSTAEVTEDNKIGLTTIRDTEVGANGDHANDYVLAIMHSKVANTLEDLQLLNFRAYNMDGMSSDVRVGRSGNMIVLITDVVPHSVNATSKQMEYTTYLFGRASLGYAKAPVDIPIERQRDAAKNGGEEYLYTRKRETILPYGFSFEMDNLPISPTDEQLETSANWKIVQNPKLIRMAQIISNG